LNCGSISEWNTLLAVQAGAAATLTGLVFVAVSINLQRVLTIPGLSGRAAESLLQFLQVFFISTVALIPRQPSKFLAEEVLGITILFWVAEIVGLIRYFRKRLGHPLWWFIDRTVISQVAIIPFALAAIYLLLGNCNGIYWIVPGFLFSFGAGILSAWVLLIEVLR
jgi:hypothetical protein